MELLKNMYNRDSLSAFAAQIKAVHEPFKADEFLNSIMDETWDSLELKGRGRQITANLGKFLPSDYPAALKILNQVVHKQNGFFGIIFPDFVETYGQGEEYWDLSIAALELYTRYSSSEFAVRPFIIKHEERMMAQMYAWTKHENEHVRRLASEGCRPALPWAQALPKYKKDPAPVLQILEALKEDSSLYVRKSVANNLNDISKTHPNLVAKIAKEWYGKNKNTDWIVKHGCRTLLKKGNRDALAIFGYENADIVEIENFAVVSSNVIFGGNLIFSFSITAKEATKVRLEYAIDFMKANGKQNRKIFQLSESTMKANEKRRYEKSHAFVNLSTRKHYPGKHAVALVVNGTEHGKIEFELEVQ